MLWAAVAYGAGIVVGTSAWRPPFWWIAATLVFIAAAAFYARRRWRLAFPLALVSLFFVGALGTQLRASGQRPGTEIFASADGSEVLVTAHVVREGEIREAHPYRLPALWYVSHSGRPGHEREYLGLHGRYWNRSCRLEGDAEKAIEQRVPDRYHPQADLLKIAHNRSLTSTTPELLACLWPRWAVISVGARNTFGHPRVETLKRLQEAGTANLPHRPKGAVTFYLDGSSVTLQLACLR